MSVQSIEDSPPANAFPTTIKANINLFKNELNKYRNKFASDLGKILPEVIISKGVSKSNLFSSQIRGKFIGEDRLIAILNDLADSPFEYGKSDIFSPMMFLWGTLNNPLCFNLSFPFGILLL